MEQYLATGRFPATPGAVTVNGESGKFIETEVRTKYWFEFLQIFVIIGVFGLAGNVLAKIWANFIHLITWS